MAVAGSVFGDEGAILHERDLQALLFANIIGVFGTGLLAPILESLITPFETSPADIGLMMSAFSAPAIVLIPIVGILTDRYGRKPILIAALLLFGAAGVAIAFTTDYRLVLGFRLIQGIGFAGIIPVIITSIGDLYAGTEEATAQGIRFTCSGLTNTVFPLVSGVLVVIAWQYPFLLYAMAFPIAVIVYRWFEEPTDVKHTGPTDTDGDTRAQLRALFGLVTQRRVFVMVLARGFPMVVWIGFITYNSVIIIRILDGTPTHAGVVVALGSLVYALAASQAGRITAMFDSRLYPLIGANVCLGVGFGIFVFAPFLVIAGIGITISGIGFGLTLSLYRSIITGLATASLRGGLVSLAEAFGRVVSTVTPILMGATIAFTTPRLGLGPALQVAGIGAAVVGSVGGIVCLLVVSASPPVDHDG